MCICYCMILLYLEGSGCKFQSVSAKTSQFCQFFEVQELREKHVNTKNSQFSTFFGFQELRKNMYIYKYICTYVYYMILLYLEGSGSKFQSVNTKTSQFCPFFGVQELRKKHVNTKNSQFSTFFWFQELRKNMYIYICTYVIAWFCYIWRVVVLSFIPSAPKLVNFPHFLDSRS